MKALFRFARVFLVLTGIYKLIYYLTQSKVTILVYHNPSQRNFNDHLRYLTKRYNILSIKDLENFFLKKKLLPKHSLLLSFDDGHRNNYYLLELLANFKVRPVVYICSSIIGTTSPFWFKIKKLNIKPLKRIPNEERVATIQESKQKELSEDLDGLALSINELNKLAKFASIQSHTMTHPILTTCSPNDHKNEIVGCRKELNRKFDIKSNHFAYPNGDYNQCTIDILRNAGYHTARTTDVGWNSRNTDPFRLKALCITDNGDLFDLKAELSGVPGYLYNLYQSGINSYSLLGRHKPVFEC